MYIKVLRTLKSAQNKWVVSAFLFNIILFKHKEIKLQASSDIILIFLQTASNLSSAHNYHRDYYFIIKCLVNIKFAYTNMQIQTLHYKGNTSM